MAVIDSSKRAEELRKEAEVAEHSGPQASEGDKPGVGSVDPDGREKLNEIQDGLEDEGQEMGLSELLTQVPILCPDVPVPL